MAIHQAGAVPSSVPRRSSPKLLEEPLKSRGARRRRGKATGQQNKKEPMGRKSCLKVVHWNAERVANKTTELSQFLYENDVKICCIQETHFQDNRKSFKIKGYQFFRNVRNGRTKGGALTLVRKNLYAKEACH